MFDRKWLFGIPIVLIGGAAMAVGLVPGVRDWFHGTFPQLGINGPAETKSNKPAISPTGLNPSDRYKTDMPGTQYSTAQDAPNSYEGNPTGYQASEPVTLAHALFPVQEPVDGGRPPQNPPPTLESVPNNGLSVPSFTPSRDGFLEVVNAELQFPLDIKIAAQADGLITEMYVDEGSLVKKGDPMIVQDTRLVESNAEVARQELLAAKLKAEDDSNVQYAKSAVKVAEVDVEISDQLYDKGSEGRMENAKKRLELTKARLQVTVSESEKKQQAAQVAVNEAKLKASSVELALRNVSAHFDGVVTEVLKKQHSWVRAGEPIVRLTSMENIRVVGNADAQNISPHLLLNAPCKVTILLPGARQKPVVEGVVSFVAPRTKGVNIYPVHVNIKNQLLPDGQYLFRDGMQATIEINYGARR
jgi:hypothetical protein